MVDFEQILVSEWNKSKNINCFLLNEHLKQTPYFISLKKDIRKQTLQAPLFQKIISGCMTHKSKNGGQKLKIHNIIYSTMRQKYSDEEIANLLLLSFVRTVPNKMVRHMKYGSGSLTRAVNLSFNKKIKWYIKTLTKNLPFNFSKEILKRIEDGYNANLKGVLLMSKKDVDAAVSSAQIE